MYHLKPDERESYSMNKAHKLFCDIIKQSHPCVKTGYTVIDIMIENIYI